MNDWSGPIQAALSCARFQIDPQHILLSAHTRSRSWLCAVLQPPSHFGTLVALWRFQFRDQLTRLGCIWTLRKTREIFAPDLQCLLGLIQTKGVKPALIEKTVFVLRVLFMRNLILFQRFLRPIGKTIRVAQISAHVRIVGAQSNRLFVSFNRAWPVFTVVVRVARCNSGLR